jgi:hypothetical protein
LCSRYQRVFPDQVAGLLQVALVGFQETAADPGLRFSS